MAHKVTALWDFDEPDYEGKVKVGSELTVNDERLRYLREKRLVQDTAIYNERNKPEKKVVKKEKAVKE